MSHDYSQWFSSKNLKKLWNCYCLSMFLRRFDQFDRILTVDIDLTAVKSNVIVLCNTHTREMLLSLPAAAVCLLLLCAAPLLLCCSAAQVQLVWLCNHWVRLHFCTLPVLFLKLLLALSSSNMAWLGLKSSNFLCLLS